MIVTLDAQRVITPSADGCTLQALIDCLHERLAGDRLLISVALDGRRLADDDLVAELERPLAADVQVDFESGTPTSVAVDTCRALADAFSTSGDLLNEAGEALARGDVPGAMAPVGRYVQLWQTTQQAFGQLGELLEQDVAAWTVNGRTLLDWLGEATARLELIRTALQARDAVALGDVIRYELPAQSANWQRLLNELADRIDAAPVGAAAGAEA